MSVLAGLFLIAHGLIHLAVWVAPSSPDAPFDARRSWLVGDLRALASTLAAAACALLVLAGALLLAGAGPADATAAAGAAVSLALVLLTFNRWFVLAVAIDLAIIAVAVA